MISLVFLSASGGVKQSVKSGKKRIFTTERLKDGKMTECICGRNRNYLRVFTDTAGGYVCLGRLFFISGDALFPCDN